MPATKWLADPMCQDFWFESKGGGSLHGCRWEPEGAPKAVVQIVHGIRDYGARYDGIASFLAAHGYLVVAEDHMGHGQSISEKIPRGFFNGGWFTAVDDTYQLMKDTMAEFPGVPYVLLGHSMGSFMARTILARYPDPGISAAIICGTAWMNSTVVAAGRMIAHLVCTARGEQYPSKLLCTLSLDSYNRGVKHPRTPYDWISRDKKTVDTYAADPLCTFIPTAGLMRDLLTGVLYIHDQKNLRSMKKDIPVFFIAGGDDAVGDFGAGVEKAAAVFRNLGMEKVDLRIWPPCRHEIFNEINRAEVYDAVYHWIEKVT